jgi:hypothetical protein
MLWWAAGRIDPKPGCLSVIAWAIALPFAVLALFMLGTFSTGSGEFNGLNALMSAICAAIAAVAFAVGWILSAARNARRGLRPEPPQARR